jgi:hypothetical protein
MEASGFVTDLSLRCETRAPREKQRGPHSPTKDAGALGQQRNEKGGSNKLPTLLCRSVISGVRCTFLGGPSVS